MIPIGEWTPAQLLRCLDEWTAEYFSGWGRPETWAEDQINQVRACVAIRVRGGKVCACGLYKSVGGRSCLVCHNAARAARPRPCMNCGGPVYPRRTGTGTTWSKNCSPECTAARILASHEALRKPGSQRVRRRANSKRRWERLRAVGGGTSGRQRVGIWRRICERDGWACWICGGPIDADLPLRHRRSGTADHVIPLIDGGDDSDDNLRAAHYSCNSHRPHGGSKGGRPCKQTEVVYGRQR